MWLAATRSHRTATTLTQPNIDYIFRRHLKLLSSFARSLYILKLKTWVKYRHKSSGSKNVIDIVRLLFSGQR